MKVEDLKEFKDYFSVLKQITVWKVAKKDNEGNIVDWEHNHIQDGHVEGEYPLPLKPEFTNQKSWKNSTWRKTFAYLNENYKVVKEALK